jgi:hypothetical protein
MPENIEIMLKNFIFLIEMKKDSLLAAGLILELKGYKGLFPFIFSHEVTQRDTKKK